MKNFKKVLLGLVGLSAIVMLAACGSSSANAVKSIQDKKTLTVALSPDYPPFEYQTIKDGKNQTVGSDVELAKKIADKLGVELKINEMSFDNVLATLSQGKADLGISGISKTAEREKSFDFSNVYYTSPNKIVIKKSDLNKYKSLSDFKGQKIAAQKGTTQESTVKDNIKDATLVSLAKIGDEINEIKVGKIAGALIEEMVAINYVEANPDLAIVDFTLPKNVETPGEGTAIALKKGSSDLKDKVNEVIKELVDSGEMKKIIQKNYDESQKNAK